MNHMMAFCRCRDWDSRVPKKTFDPPQKMLVAIVLTIFALLIVGVIVALGVLVARLAVRQKEMQDTDEKLLSDQLKLKDTAKKIDDRVGAVDARVGTLGARQASFEAGTGRNAVRVASDSAISSARPAVETFATTSSTTSTPTTSTTSTPTTSTTSPSSTSTTTPPTTTTPAAPPSTWVHVTDATNSRYLPGGLRAANLWARDSVAVSSGRVLAANLFAPAGSVRFYRAAQVVAPLSTAPPSFAIKADVRHAGGTYAFLAHLEVDASGSAPRISGRVTATSSAGGAAPGPRQLWTTSFGAAVAFEPGARRATLYIKLAPTGSDMSAAIDVTAWPASGAQMVLGGSAPLTPASFAAPIGPAQDAAIAESSSLTLHADGAAFDVVSVQGALTAASVATADGRTSIAAPDGHSYLRAGAAGSNVYVGDAAAGGVWVGHALASLPAGDVAIAGRAAGNSVTIGGNMGPSGSLTLGAAGGARVQMPGGACFGPTADACIDAAAATNVAAMARSGWRAGADGCLRFGSNAVCLTADGKLALNGRAVALVP
jgi:hypothetical protein